MKTILVRFSGFWIGRSRRIRAGVLALVATTAVVFAAPTTTMAARDAASGGLDPSFGTGGYVATGFPGTGGVNGADIALTALVLPGGKILAAGRGGTGAGPTGGDFALAQYNADGTPDTTFGDGGKVITPITVDRDLIRVVARYSDGRILAGGLAGAELPGDMALARYYPDGSLDPTFGNGGIVKVDLSGLGDGARAIEILPDEKILVAGAANVNPVLVRFNPDGSMDSTFGDGGKIILGSDLGHIFAMKRASDGKLVVAGAANTDFMVARFNPDGSLDTTFGQGGKTTTDFSGIWDNALDLVIQSDGKIVIAGWANAEDFTAQAGELWMALARYNTDGSLDATYGNGGKVILNPTVAKDLIRGIALQPDGKVVAVGNTEQADVSIQSDTLPHDGQLALARLNVNGTLDTSFGDNGLVRSTFATGQEGQQIAIQRYRNGSGPWRTGILVVGSILPTETNMDFLVARYQAD